MGLRAVTSGGDLRRAVMPGRRLHTRQGIYPSSVSMKRQLVNAPCAPKALGDWRRLRKRGEHQKLVGGD
jgi:hypothetical protein